MTDLKRALAHDLSSMIRQYKDVGLDIPTIISTIKSECARVSELEREHLSQKRATLLSDLRSSFESSAEFSAYIQAIETVIELRPPFEDSAVDLVVAAWRASVEATKAYGRLVSAAGVSSGSTDVSLTPSMTADWVSLSNQEELTRWMGRHRMAEAVLKRLRSHAMPFADAVRAERHNWERETALTAVTCALSNGALRRSEIDRIAGRALKRGRISDWEAESLGLRGGHGLKHFKEGRFWFVALHV